MITPELISYIRGELTKGRAREEIRSGLVREGGWSEADLNEAFKVVIPVQSPVATSPIQKSQPPSLSSVSPLPSSTFSTPSFSVPASSSKPFLRKVFLIVAIVLIVGGLGVASWFYRDPLINLWDLGVKKITSLFTPKPPAITDNTVAPSPSLIVPSQTDTVIQNVVVNPKDCGVGVAPDLKKPATYQNDAVLTCLGNSALNCADSRAILKDALFPTVVQIVSAEGSCNFKLSYAEDSALTDATGAKLAGQYVSCPLSLVKAVDETQTTSSFTAPSTDNLSKYASQIYFYGTLGLFIENNLDQNRIHALGCSGPYIDSVIASFKKMQEKR